MTSNDTTLHISAIHLLSHQIHSSNGSLLLRCYIATTAPIELRFGATPVQRASSRRTKEPGADEENEEKGKAASLRSHLALVHVISSSIKFQHTNKIKERTNSLYLKLSLLIYGCFMSTKKGIWRDIFIYSTGLIDCHSVIPLLLYL